MQIVGKVLDGAYDAVGKTIAKSIRERHPATGPIEVTVTPVFPGLKTGRRAGMFTIDLPDHLPAAIVASVMETLRGEIAVEYAELPSQKTTR